MKADLPDHMHITASNRQYFVLAVTGAVFVIMLSAMRFMDEGPTEDINVWMTVFFAIVTLIGASAALLKRSWLTLDRDGFESSELKSLGRVTWADVSEFSLHNHGGRGMPASRQVTFKLSPERRKTATRLAGMMFGGTVRLTAPYHVKGEKLVRLMNRFRERAVGPAQVSS